MKHCEQWLERTRKKKHTLISPLIFPFGQRAFETLCQVEGVQAVCVPTGSTFEGRVHILHMWGMVPQAKGMNERMDGHHIHPGQVA